MSFKTIKLLPFEGVGRYPVYPFAFKSRPTEIFAEERIRISTHLMKSDPGILCTVEKNDPDNLSAERHVYLLQSNCRKLNRPHALAVVPLLISKEEEDVLVNAGISRKNLKNTIITFLKLKNSNGDKSLDIVFDPNQVPNGWLENFNRWLLDSRSGLPEKITCGILYFRENTPGVIAREGRMLIPVFPPEVYRRGRFPYFANNLSLQIIKDGIKSCEVEFSETQGGKLMRCHIGGKITTIWISLDEGKPVSKQDGLKEEKIYPVLSRADFVDDRSFVGFCCRLNELAAKKDKVKSKNPSLDCLAKWLEKRCRSADLIELLVEKYGKLLRGAGNEELVDSARECLYRVKKKIKMRITDNRTVPSEDKDLIIKYNRLILYNIAEFKIYLKAATQDKPAVSHFNISDTDILFTKKGFLLEGEVEATGYPPAIKAVKIGKFQISLKGTEKAQIISRVRYYLIAENISTGKARFVLYQNPDRKKLIGSVEILRTEYKQEYTLDPPAAEKHQP